MQIDSQAGRIGGDVTIAREEQIAERAPAMIGAFRSESTMLAEAPESRMWDRQPA